MSGASSSILLVADPGVPAAIAERLSDSLQSALMDCAAADGKWDVSVRRDSYPVDEHAEVFEVIRIIDPAGEPEDFVIYLTDLPRRVGTTPIVVDISLNNRFGLISIPGMGGVFIDRRVRNLAQTVVTELTCESGRQHGSMKRLTRTQDDSVVRYVAPTALSRLHLLMGMVYANRPWRLAAGLSKVLMAAFAAGAVSLAYPTIWQLSDTMGPWRLSVATILASAAMIGWLILHHKLWERPPSAGERERAVLYNAATVVTLTIGVAILHIRLFILLLLTAWWTLPPQLVAHNIGHTRRPLILIADGLAGVGGSNIGRCPGIRDGGRRGRHGRGIRSSPTRAIRQIGLTHVPSGESVSTQVDRWLHASLTVAGPPATRIQANRFRS